MLGEDAHKIIPYTSAIYMHNVHYVKCKLRHSYEHSIDRPWLIVATSCANGDLHRKIVQQSITKTTVRSLTQSTHRQQRTVHGFGSRRKQETDNAGQVVW